MTTKTLLFAAFLPAVAAFIVQPVGEYTDEVYRTLKVAPPLNLARGCDDVMMQAAQADFNKALDIDVNLNWRNASKLELVVRNRMFPAGLTAGPRDYLKVCIARTAFYQRLALLWDSCINRYHLLNSMKTATNISAPYLYVNMWKHLDFTCNAGAEIAMKNFFNLNGFQTNPAFEKCMTAFHKGLQDDPTSLCSNSNTLLSCASSAWTTYSAHPIVGWYICEDLRVGFAYDCPNLRCYVIPPKN